MQAIIVTKPLYRAIIDRIRLCDHWISSAIAKKDPEFRNKWIVEHDILVGYALQISGEIDEEHN